MNELQNILSPIEIGNKTCKNRIIMAAHSYGYADQDGLPTQELEYYLEERAKGGIGLVIMGGTSVSKNGTIPTGNPTKNLNDKIVKPYKKIAERVHKHGTLVLDQLMHAGGQLRNRTGLQIFAPSSVHHERTRGVPLTLSKAQIDEISTDFSLAARRAKMGGLDGVEIKCDQGFLIQQFLSPYYNFRTDEYGGTRINRIRFLLEILEKTREEVGHDFIVGVRITGNAYAYGDIGEEEALEISKIVATEDLIDYLHINGATNSTYRGYLLNHGDSSLEERNFSHLSKKIKESVGIPVIVASMIATPYDAEYLVKHKYADLVAMTRSHIADPEIIRKVENGQLSDIRPCIRCNQECVGGHHLGAPVRCIHNPATGREKELGIGTIRKASKSKNLLIVGGGVSGMEVARVAALRGLKVHLLEKQRELGGQLLLASKLPYMQGLRDIAHYLENQIKKLKVNIYLQNEVTIENFSSVIEDMNSVVISIGSNSHIPPIYQNIDPRNALTPVDILKENINLLKNILIVDVDWRQNPLAVAEWLIQRNHQVTIISSGYFIGEGINIASRASYYSRIQRKAKFFPLTDFVSHKGNVACLRNVLDNEIFKIEPIDQVVFVSGLSPNRNLQNIKVEPSIDVHFVGDCMYPNGVTDAILQANRIARTL